jgi:hypothetical protein
MRLGQAVHKIRTPINPRFLSEDKPERREWLDEMGFVWGEQNRRWLVTKRTLITYKVGLYV